MTFPKPITKPRPLNFTWYIRSKDSESDFSEPYWYACYQAPDGRTFNISLEGFNLFDQAVSQGVNLYVEGNYEVMLTGPATWRDVVDAVAQRIWMTGDYEHNCIEVISYKGSTHASIPLSL